MQPSRSILHSMRIFVVPQITLPNFCTHQIVGWGNDIPEHIYTGRSKRFSRPPPNEIAPLVGWVDFGSRHSSQTCFFFWQFSRARCASGTKYFLRKMMYDPYAKHVHEAALRHQVAQNERRTTRKVPTTFVREVPRNAADSCAMASLCGTTKILI